MKHAFTLFAVLFLASRISAQTNILSTNPIAEQVMLGNYDPAQYMASNVINHPDSIAA